MGIPQRLVESMVEVNNLDEAEGEALAAAVVQSFGPCLCQSWRVFGGHRVWVEMCAGHQFLCEDDRACTRIQHLRFARDQRGRWLAAEFGHAAMLQQALDDAGL